MDYNAVDDIDLARWMVSELRPGESCTYYSGNILRDRTKSIVRQLADEVYRRARAGELYLTQRRISPAIETTKRGKTVTRVDQFAYIATRRRHA